MKPTKSNLLQRLFLGGLVALAFSSTAHAWWEGDWTMRKKITLDTTATGVAIPDATGALPVLVRLHEGNFQFSMAKEDGSDLRFVAEDDKTLLPYHIERYDPLLNEAFVWVKSPALKAGAKTSFWLYYGNAGNKVVKVEDTKGTYDAGTVLVYHFSERGQPAYDYTVSGNTAGNIGTPAEGSMIGGGLRFDGKGDLVVKPSPSLAWPAGADMTWSAWIKSTAPQANAVVFSRWDGGNAFLVGVDKGVPFVEVTRANNTRRTTPGAPIAANAWKHLAVVVSGSALTLYVDGEPYATLNASLPALDVTAFIGGDGPVGAVEASGERSNFIGEIDEMEISKIARTPGFIKLAAVSQAGGDTAAKLLVLGEDEHPSDPLAWLKGGYFGIIIASLTFDGWVVIGVLAVMSVISWFVMVGKFSYLSAITKGNALFMKEWAHISTDLTVMDEGESDKVKSLEGRVDAAELKAMRNTPLYRIYHIGSEEIRRRIDADLSAGSKKALSARSIQAIRASLDGGLVRESQKLSRQMVLLTIAISGGPFLGLLGTVVGVMITFAAVAAAGEVNVNAIAPGIAAALLATVAGLAVAIPALFGYNYLVTRVKETTSDMHVFIDEFVTKMAEFYRGRSD